MAKTNVMVLVDDQHGNTLDSVAREIARSGVEVGRVIRGMKTIFGEVSDLSVIEKVRGVDGVVAVREEGVFSLPPMDRNVAQ
jgi:hypothetical protein